MGTQNTTIMISTIYWIDEEKIGPKQLGIMARPRGNDWLEDEIKWLKIRQVDYLISLLENSEIWELGLENEEEFCKNKGIQFINFPIPDVNIPKDKNQFLILVDQLVYEITEGKKIVIHCRMGIGRASVLAAAIMIKLGFPREEVFDMIGKHRGLSVPDTTEQKKWTTSL